MHNFFVHGHNVYCLVAFSLFETFALFCLQLSIVLLDANKNKLLLLQFIQQFSQVYAHVGITLIKNSNNLVMITTTKPYFRKKIRLMY